MLKFNLGVFLFIDFGLSLFIFEFRFRNSAYRRRAFYGSLLPEFCQ